MLELNVIRQPWTRRGDGETNETNVLKDPDMLRRLNQISELPEEDKHCILYTLDGLLQNVKAKQAFNH